MLQQSMQPAHVVGKTRVPVNYRETYAQSSINSIRQCLILTHSMVGTNRFRLGISQADVECDLYMRYPAV
jgi:hypothetical protein